MYTVYFFYVELEISANMHSKLAIEVFQNIVISDLPIMLKYMTEWSKALIPPLLVIAVIIFFWYLMWKLVLEPNPLIRDFFDLDQKSRTNKNI